MSLFAWIIFGLTIGFIGHALDSRPAKGGIIGALVFGVAGAVFGGTLASVLFGTAPTSLNISTLLIAVSGALLLLMIQRTVFSKSERF